MNKENKLFEIAANGDIIGSCEFCGNEYRKSKTAGKKQRFCSIVCREKASYLRRISDPENKRRDSEKLKKWISENREKYLSNRREYSKNRTKLDPGFHKRWRDSNREHVRQYNIKSLAKSRESLSDWYVATCITNNSKILKRENIPKELIECKKILIQLNRTLKTQNNEIE